MKLIKYLKELFGSKGSDDPIRLSGHHLQALSEYVLNGKVSRDPRYGSLFYENIDRTFKRILSNPRQKIKVVTGIDDLCEYCGLTKKDVKELYKHTYRYMYKSVEEKEEIQKEFCANVSPEHDEMYIRAAGLETNQIYDAKTVLKRLKNKSFGEVTKKVFYTKIVLKLVDDLVGEGRFTTGLKLIDKLINVKNSNDWKELEPYIYLCYLIEKKPELKEQLYDEIENLC